MPALGAVEQPQSAVRLWLLGVRMASSDVDGRKKWVEGVGFSRAARRRVLCAGLVDGACKHTVLKL